ncbi:MAG TPA: site-specific integrase [Candidatus Sulfotelmatobacter sp.]|nr:site-specific integrase [Candidatus Sulfotelmatobacter sp.]
MSRRSGQSGRIEKAGNNYYARFWADDLQTGERRYKCVRICAVNGPGSLNLSQRRRRLLEIIQESGCNSEESCRTARGAFLGTTFREQSEAWLASLCIRKRRPVKPHTLCSFESALRYINSKVGGCQLADFKNAQLKQFISEMAAEMKGDRLRFRAKSIANYVQVIKAVIASAIDSDGEQLYPRDWNDEFLDAPTIGDQWTPAFSASEIESIIAKADDQDKFFFALLAGSGLRVGEAIALRVEDLEGSTLHVRHSLWNSQPGTPKTAAGIRDVDLHSSLAAALAQHLGERKIGYVFENGAGGALHQSNVLRRSLHPILERLKIQKQGFHGFRRFRVTHLRKQRAPEDLIKFWLGHAPVTVTDGYSQLKADIAYRAMVAEQCGVGFRLELPVATVASEPELHEMHETATPVTC